MAHAVPIPAGAGDQLAPILLPKPHMSGGQPLLDALHQRKTTREFSPRQPSLDLLSDLLWAANGYNRPDTKHRTAPTAHDRQEIDVYAALASGLYLYDAETNRLRMISKQDLRSATGEQDYVATAPLDLVYVADLARMDATADRATKKFYAALDAGFIAQNVYLFCASQGLATVVRGLVPRATLGPKMGLRPEQRIIVAQSVGFPR